MSHLTSRLNGAITHAYLQYRFPCDPIVLGGAPRSGTTLLLSLLGNHSHIHAIDYETTAFHPYFRPHKLLAALVFKDNSRQLRHITKTKKRICEKTPGNIRHIPEINHFFKGKVKFINIFRDGRDVITSRHPLRPEEYWVPIQRWIDDTQAGIAAASLPNVFSIKYEDLVTDGKDALHKLCDFIGEEYEDGMLSYYKDKRQTKIGAWAHESMPVHSKSIRKWEAAEHSEILSKFMENSEAVTLLMKLGYLQNSQNDFESPLEA
jgi:hypothetical protein